MLHTSKMRVQPNWPPSIGVSIMCGLVDGPAIVVAVHVGHARSMQGTVEWGL